jgi:hypothetical protein
MHVKVQRRAELMTATLSALHLHPSPPLPLRCVLCCLGPVLSGYLCFPAPRSSLSLALSLSRSLSLSPSLSLSLSLSPPLCVGLCGLRGSASVSSRP